jgi:hypothetical protein
MDAFISGIMPDDGKPIDLLDREDWKAIVADTSDKLDLEGERVSVRLLVELPFWLLTPESTISVAHEETAVQAAIFQKYLEVSQGPLYYNSHTAVKYIAHADDLKPDAVPPALAGLRPAILRQMKTVIVFQPEALKQALDWRQERIGATDDKTQTLQPAKTLRHLNQANLYLCSLAFAHIPFLNQLITSYRAVSFDPFAFEVSEWDVPTWYVQFGDAQIQVALVPYWSTDTYPAVSALRSTGAEAYIAASKEAVQAQAIEEVMPGKLELLDALSLYHRGRFGDAVRSAVTAIEVILEAQLYTLLRQQEGYGDEEAERRLAETRNSFHDRLRDYEKVSQRRLPSPMVSWLPTINGVRLKQELGWVRELRHKVVHEGVRVDIFADIQMQRAIETMTWLFRWLSGEDYNKENNRNFTFFNSAQGGMFRRIFGIKYTGTGVLIRDGREDVEHVGFVSTMLSEQYVATISEYPCDVELFAKMSLVRLGFGIEDAPPELADDPLLRETYRISHNGRKSLVFCLEFDGLIDGPTIGQVTLRLLAHTGAYGPGWGGLCIVHHQRHVPWAIREIDEAIPEDIDRIATECGLSLITTPDLCLLMQAGPEYKWGIDRVRDLLFLPGRQGVIPPAYRAVGRYVRFYDRPSVMSVQLDDGAAVCVGDVLGIRLATRYYEEQIESLQVEHDAVQTAIGPKRVGIKTKLRKADFHVGQRVYVREQEQPTGNLAEAGDGKAPTTATETDQSPK